MSSYCYQGKKVNWRNCFWAILKVIALLGTLYLIILSLMRISPLINSIVRELGPLFMLYFSAIVSVLAFVFAGACICIWWTRERQPKPNQPTLGRFEGRSKPLGMLAIAILVPALLAACSSINKPLPATNANSSVALMKFEKGIRIIESTDGWKIQQIELKKLNRSWQEFATKVKAGDSVRVNVVSISSNGQVSFLFADEADEELYQICEAGE